jgi:hypothetical protein
MFRMRLKNLCTFVSFEGPNLPSSTTLPLGFTATFHMRFSKLLLLASLLVATEAAQAGKPILGTVIESDHVYPWEKQRINASEAAEIGDATKAFNFLQDQLSRSEVDEVWYDFDSDLYHWRGPETGNRMAMPREKFEKEILEPYLRGWVSGDEGRRGECYPGLENATG